MICPICEKDSSISIVHRTEVQSVKKETVEADVEISYCSSCEGEFETVEQMRSNLENFRNIYRTRYGIIFPQEIIDLRKKYDISQKALGRILDIGELTINSYEQGAIPSGAHNSLLRLTALPRNFAMLFERNKKKLSSLQIRKIEKKLSAIKGGGEDPKESFLYSNSTSEEILYVAESSSPYNGYAAAEMRKIFGMIQLLVHEAGVPLYKMAVLKLLFYCDFSYYAKHGISISGWRYIKLQYGPVPDDFKKILWAGDALGRFIVQPDEEEMGDLVALREGFDVRYPSASFSPTELETIRKVANELGKKSAAALSRLTHEESAWMETPEKEAISYTFARVLKHGV